MAGVKVSVTGQRELEELGHRLKVAGEKELTKELRKGLKKASVPAVRAAQAAIRALPVRGVRGGGLAAREIHQQRRRVKARRLRAAGLRESIARAIKAQISTSGAASVRIRTSSSELPSDQRKLPRHLDSAKGWWHPVFGNREAWAQQYGKPWFGETLKKQGPTVRKETLAAMDEVARKITKG